VKKKIERKENNLSTYLATKPPRVSLLKEVVLLVNQAEHTCHISVYCVQWSHKRKKKKEGVLPVYLTYLVPTPPMASMYSRPTPTGYQWGGCMHIYLSIGFSVGSSQKKKGRKERKRAFEGLTLPD